MNKQTKIVYNKEKSQKKKIKKPIQTQRHTDLHIKKSLTNTKFEIIICM